MQVRKPGGRALIRPTVPRPSPGNRGMELGQRAQGRRVERRQAHEVRLVLLGEVAIEPVGCLDESVVRPIGPDQGNGEPPPAMGGWPRCSSPKFRHSR